MNVAEFLEARISEDEDRAKKHYASASAKGLGDYPLRITSECAAKRAILANVPRNSDLYDAHAYTSAHTIRVLASVYADHPDYREEWKL